MQERRGSRAFTKAHCSIILSSCVILAHGSVGGGAYGSLLSGPWQCHFSMTSIGYLAMMLSAVEFQNPLRFDECRYTGSVSQLWAGARPPPGATAEPGAGPAEPADASASSAASGMLGAAGRASGERGPGCSPGSRVYLPASASNEAGPGS